MLNGTGHYHHNQHQQPIYNTLRHHYQSAPGDNNSQPSVNSTTENYLQQQQQHPANIKTTNKQRLASDQNDNDALLADDDDHDDDHFQQRQTANGFNAPYKIYSSHNDLDDSERTVSFDLATNQQATVNHVKIPTGEFRQQLLEYVLWRPLFHTKMLLNVDWMRMKKKWSNHSSD